MNTLGNRIRIIRSEILKISQTELALIMGLKTKVGISSWELNKAEPSVEQLLKLSEMSGKSIEWILTGAERDEAAHCTVKEKKLEAEVRKLKDELKQYRDVVRRINKDTEKITEGR